MKILIDTNVLISGVLRDRNPEKAILFILLNNMPGSFVPIILL
jgi:predicted nucleic acid-binding protein